MLYRIPFSTKGMLPVTMFTLYFTAAFTMKSRMGIVCSARLRMASASLCSSYMDISGALKNSGNTAKSLP